MSVVPAAQPGSPQPAIRASDSTGRYARTTDRRKGITGIPKQAAFSRQDAAGKIGMRPFRSRRYQTFA